MPGGAVGECLVAAAVCVYLIAYRFYSLFIATKVIDMPIRTFTLKLKQYKL